MVKKSRKAKNKHKDFQKVKLKVGRKLNKADNVTNTSFKSRGIHIKEQLSAQKTDSSLPTTKRKQDFAELTTQLSHYNPSVRRDAVLGLQELLSAHPSLIHIHLSKIIECLSALFVDKDAKVRQAVIDILKHLLPQISANALSAFFSLVCAHLCCAMTHIFEDIKLHSLVFLDQFLVAYPSLVARHGSKILSIFLDQILQRNQVRKSATWGGKGAIALSINPNSKLASQKWRGKVLDRLRRLLEAMVVNEGTSKGDVSSRTAEQGSHCGNHYFQSAVWVMGSNCMENMINSNIRVSSLSSAEADSGALMQNTQKLTELVETLVPMLLQFWMEVSPGTSAGSAVREDVVLTMLSILGIVKLLWQCLSASSEPEHSMDWFRGKFLRDFTTHFMCGFPYAVHHHPGKGSKSSPANRQMAVMQLNVAVCDLMSQFVLEKKDAVPDFITSVMNYLIGCASRNNLPDSLQVTYAGILIRLLKLEGLPAESKQSIFGTMYNLHEKGHIDVNTRILMMQFLCQNVVEGRTLAESEVFSRWMQTLPSYLLQCKTSAERGCYVDVICGMAVCKPPVLMKAISSLIPELTDIFHDFPADQQMSLLYLLTCQDDLSQPHLRQLSKLCLHSKTELEHVHMIIQILHHRLEKKCAKRTQVYDYADFFSFLLSLIFNTPPSTAPSVVSTLQTSTWQVEEGFQDWAGLHRHHAMLQIVCSAFTSCPNVPEVWTIISEFIQRNMGHDVVSVPTAYGIIYISSAVNLHQRPAPPVLLHGLANLCLNLMCSVSTVQQNEPVSVSKDFFLENVSCLLCNNPSVIREILFVLTSIVKDAERRDGIPQICCILKELLTAVEVKTAARQYTDHLSSLVNLIQESYLTGGITAQWFTDLKYEISLIKTHS